VTNSTRAIADRVKELRQKRGWSASALADECAELGMPALNRSVIANLESGRRAYVTTDEMLALAYALDVAPIHLLVPLEEDESVEQHRYNVTPGHPMHVPVTRQWIRGEFCPPGRDPRIYFSEVPREEWEPPAMSAEGIEKSRRTYEKLRGIEDQMLPDRARRRASQRKKEDGNGR
jgi:transcriptional regulator with XRE-family HTH domain